MNRVKRYLTAFSSAAIGIMTALPAMSAEKIQFFYGPFEPTIYVDDLATFAETGEVSDRFAAVANRLDNYQKESLRDFLTAQYELDAVSVSQFTYSPIGERLLQRVGQLIRTENFLNGMKAVRAGLIFAAQDSEQGYTPLTFLQQYPLETIQLDAALMQKMIAENERIFKRSDRIANKITQAAKAEATAATSASLTKSAAPATQSTAPGFDPKDPGAHAWQIETIQFQNPERPEASAADIYYPSDAETLSNIPVVVISHGYASTQRSFAYLAKHLASHGYAVVALEHIETDRDKIARFLDGLEGAPDPRHLLQRPRDITAVLDTLETYREDNPALKGIDLERVGLLGQSLGGYTVLAAAGAEINREKLLENCSSDLSEQLTLNLSMLLQCRILEIPEETSLSVADPRISAVVAINPLTSHIFGESGMQQLQVPVMMVGSTRDYFVPTLPEQIEPFSWLTTKDKSLVLIAPGTHFSALESDQRYAFPIPQGLIGAEPSHTFSQLQALSLSFFNQHMRGETQASSFLSQAYLDSVPAASFQFSLTNDYPVEWLAQ